jgi:hypothetical protein
VCEWNGCRTLPSEAIGIGQGRLYWPGEPVQDPDEMAAMVRIPNSYPVHSDLYVPAPAPYVQTMPVIPAKPNRYSAPYYG